MHLTIRMRGGVKQTINASCVRPLAVFKWLTRISGDDLVDAVQQDLERIGLVVQQEASSCYQLYAVDASTGPLQLDQRVQVIATWSDRSSGEILVEVRSNESMLRPQSRCELVAKQLKASLEPIVT